jgi:hypothetical protein
VPEPETTKLFSIPKVAVLLEAVRYFWLGKILQVVATLEQIVVVCLDV